MTMTDVVAILAHDARIERRQVRSDQSGFESTVWSITSKKGDSNDAAQEVS